MLGFSPCRTTANTFMVYSAMFFLFLGSIYGKLQVSKCGKIHDIAIDIADKDKCLYNLKFKIWVAENVKRDQSVTLMLQAKRPNTKSLKVTDILKRYDAIPVDQVEELSNIKLTDEYRYWLVLKYEDPETGKSAAIISKRLDLPVDEPSPLNQNTDSEERVLGANEDRNPGNTWFQRWLINVRSHKITAVLIFVCILILIFTCSYICCW